MRMFERLRGTVGYGGDLGVATSCLAHQDSGQPVAGPVDYFRAQAHLVVRLPAEAERVREPVDAVENEADMQSVDNGLIRHTGGTHASTPAAVSCTELWLTCSSSGRTASSSGRADSGLRMSISPPDSMLATSVCIRTQNGHWLSRELKTARYSRSAGVQKEGPLRT